MNDKNLLIHMDPVQGYNKVFEVGEYNMRLTRFGLIKLAAGTSYSDNTGEMEVALVLMGGNFKASGDGWSFTVENGRKSPFTGKPHCLYMPRRTAYTIEALSDVELAYNGSPVTCGNDQFWVKSGSEFLPEGYRIEVKIEGSQTAVGKGESRIIYAIIYDADGNDITSQNELRVERGVIEVMPIKIVVYTASASKSYDGRKLSAEECAVAMGKLIDGHTLKAEGYTYIVNIGSVSNSVESIEIYDKDGNRVTDCYEIQVVEGTLTVTGDG